ncbi:hypothetical protein [uncultured Enterovirga sp.]|uniref:hypothetical protein n=1 Tax=uncultured Enterovirga sp. TaxID=2026352 RepID=UPI0035CB7B0C
MLLAVWVIRLPVAIRLVTTASVVAGIVFLLPADFLVLFATWASGLPRPASPREVASHGRSGPLASRSSQPG